jgi:hypothetical protein
MYSRFNGRELCVVSCGMTWGTLYWSEINQSWWYVDAGQN